MMLKQGPEYAASPRECGPLSNRRSSCVYFDVAILKFAMRDPKAAYLSWLRGGETIYSKVAGSRRIDNTSDSPLQVDPVFYIASLSNAITTLARMTAVENGLVTIDENVRDIKTDPGTCDRPNIVEAGYTHPLVFSLAKGWFMAMWVDGDRDITTRRSNGDNMSALTNRRQLFIIIRKGSPPLDNSNHEV
ncbi:hypothetical protein V494_02465 [Pseudogymnoascus sp. VKM F-4513 (FW-928)]|nr:hypothetical protein V494_02465 [Pseudogymnoascus sp. VKM F-4513 (FW-928)]